MPRPMSVCPVAIQTLTPLGIIVGSKHRELAPTPPTFSSMLTRLPSPSSISIRPRPSRASTVARASIDQSIGRLSAVLQASSTAISSVLRLNVSASQKTVGSLRKAPYP
jgi:hypothetical protein